MASSNSPCAACKLQRRKCTQECVFAPYFPPDQPQRFAFIHRVFGASNVAKILNELPVTQREDAVNSLYYEAEARLRDPVYGCVGFISFLQHRLRQLQNEILNAKTELSAYIGPQAMLPLLPNQYPPFVQGHLSPMIPQNMVPLMGLSQTPSHGGGQLVIREPQQQQLFEAQQFVASGMVREQQQLFEAQQLVASGMVREQQHQETFRTYEQHQHQPQQSELVRYNHGLDAPAGAIVTGFNQMTPASMSPPFGFGNFDGSQFQFQTQPLEHQDHPQTHQLQAQLFLQPQLAQPYQSQRQQQQQERSGSEEGRSVGPSC